MRCTRCDYELDGLPTLARDVVKCTECGALNGTTESTDDTKPPVSWATVIIAQLPVLIAAGCGWGTTGYGRWFVAHLMLPGVILATAVVVALITAIDARSNRLKRVSSTTACSLLCNLALGLPCMWWLFDNAHGC